MIFQGFIGSPFDPSYIYGCKDPSPGKVKTTEPSNWTPSDAADAPPPLFTALSEQLGLKLSSEKTPVDVIVIDHVDHPSPN
jgi:uncharacterized protein (TIGR03435 family)